MLLLILKNNDFFFHFYVCKVFDKFVDYSGNSDDSETLSINEKPSKTDSLKDKTSTIFQIVAILRNTATIAIFSA